MSGMDDMSTISHARETATPITEPDLAPFRTLSSKVYQVLRDEILSGALPPHTRLVRRTISRRLGVSPMPVTEALLRLEQDGLVESEPMFGARVKAWTLESVRGDEVLREALECQAARLCAERASDNQLRELAEEAKTLDAIMAKREEDSPEGMRAHCEFHVRIARFTGCPALEAELRRVWTRRLMLWNWLNAAMFPVPEDWHQQLTGALASRDPDLAGKRAREHVRFNQAKDSEVLKRIQETQRRSAEWKS
jgi:DNA-binding GntR family transcriptional regulator